MYNFAGEILTGNELIGLGIFLLVCGVAIFSIALFSLKIAYSVVKLRTYSRKHLSYVAIGIAVLILANILIEM